MQVVLFDSEEFVCIFTETSRLTNAIHLRHQFLIPPIQRLLLLHPLQVLRHRQSDRTVNVVIV